MLATLHISIYPTMGWATSQTENTRCVNRALIKLVPLKLICFNALLSQWDENDIIIHYYSIIIQHFIHNNYLRCVSTFSLYLETT